METLKFIVLGLQQKRIDNGQQDKLMIITYYEKGHSKHSTADKFGIQLKQLRDWLNNKEKLMRVAPYTQRI